MSVDTTACEAPMLWSRDYCADPHPTNDWLRTHDPLHHDPRSGLTVLTRYDDVVAALRSPWVSAAGGQQARQENGGVAASMLTTDGDEHRRLRAPAQLLLSPSAIHRLDDKMAALTERAVSTVPAEFDLERDLCGPWATSVLATLLDVPDGPDLHVFSRITPTSRAALSPIPSPLVAARARRCNEQLGSFLRRHLHHLQQSGRSTGAARLAEDERLTDDEKVAVLALCVVGGWSPLADLASSGIQVALADPTARSWLSDSTRSSTYLDELVRWHSPIPYVARRTCAPLSLPSGSVPEGAFVLAFLNAANHDPSKFTQPHRMTPGRNDVPSLGFGHGAHFCMGAALVRRAIPGMLTAFMSHCPDSRAATHLQWAREQFPRRARSTAVRIRP